MFGNSPVVIPQMRRVHKLASMETAEMNIVVHPRVYMLKKIKININFVDIIYLYLIHVRQIG